MLEIWMTEAVPVPEALLTEPHHNSWGVIDTQESNVPKHKAARGFHRTAAPFMVLPCRQHGELCRYRRTGSSYSATMRPILQWKGVYDVDQTRDMLLTWSNNDWIERAWLCSTQTVCAWPNAIR